MLNGVIFIYHFSLHRDLSYPQVCTNYSLNVKWSVISIVSIIRIRQTIDISFETFHIQLPNKPADRGPRTDSVFFTLARVRFMKHWVCMTHVSACAKKTGARITRIKLGTPVKHQCYYHNHSYIFKWLFRHNMNAASSSQVDQLPSFTLSLVYFLPFHL